MADKKNLMTPVLPFFSILAFLRTVSNISQASNSTFSFKWNKHIPLISVKNVFFCNSVAHFLPFLVLQLSYSFLTLASIVLKHLKLIKKNKKHQTTWYPIQMFGANWTLDLLFCFLSLKHKTQLFYFHFLISKNQCFFAISKDLR